MPSNTLRPARSSLNPRWTRSRSTRPLCEMPKPSAWRMRGRPCGASGLSFVAWRKNETMSRIAAKPMPITSGSRAVDELEDRAAVEARCGRPRDLDMAIVDQTPREAGRRDAWIAFALPHRQCRTGQVGNRMDQRADKTLLGQFLDVAVAEQPGGLGDELLPHRAGHAGDDGKARSQAIGPGRHVTLPAAPHHREAAPHQKAVAGVLGVSAVRCAAQPRYDRLGGAIGHVIHQADSAALEIKRVQDADGA